MTNHLRLALLGALVASAIWPTVAQPQNYPNRTITFVVPFAAGGLTDVPARILAAMMQERIGQNIVIENKPGGSGVVGGTTAGSRHRRQAAVQVAGGAGGRRQGQSDENQFRHIRSGDFARDRADATQFARQDRDRGRALSRLRRGGAQRRGGWH